jgi:hypothetical protein
MKNIILCLCLLLTTQLATAQYTFTSKEGKVFENKNKGISTDYQQLQYHTLTSYGFKIETVQYGFGGSIALVEVEEITYGDLLLMVKNNAPEIKEHKRYSFFLSYRQEDLVYSATYRKTSDVEVKKESTMQVYVNGTKKDAEDYLNMLIDKAKEVTSKAGYKDDRSSFTAFSALDKAAEDKKVEGALIGLDLDLSTDEEKAAKEAKNRELQVQQKAQKEEQAKKEAKSHGLLIDVHRPFYLYGWALYDYNVEKVAVRAVNRITFDAGTADATEYSWDSKNSFTKNGKTIYHNITTTRNGDNLDIMRDGKKIGTCQKSIVCSENFPVASEVAAILDYFGI